MDLIVSMVVLIITCVGVYYTRKQYLLQRKKNLVTIKPASPDKISQSDIEQKSNSLMIRSKNLSKNDIETFSMLIEASTRLLEKDRLSGCWGRTIYKHINITQYGSMWTDQRIYKYNLRLFNTKWDTNIKGGYILQWRPEDSDWWDKLLVSQIPDYPLYPYFL